MTTTKPKTREGQTGTCHKCHLAITFLGGIWTVTEGEQYGEINCWADLSAAYAPHEPVTAKEA